MTCASTCRPHLLRHVTSDTYACDMSPVACGTCDRTHLRQGYSTVDWTSLSKLVAKLDAGRPLTVLAVGSSITSYLGGHLLPSHKVVAAPGAVAGKVVVVPDVDVDGHGGGDAGWTRRASFGRAAESGILCGLISN